MSAESSDRLAAQLAELDDGVPPGELIPEVVHLHADLLRLAQLVRTPVTPSVAADEAGLDRAMQAIKSLPIRNSDEAANKVPMELEPGAILSTSGRYRISGRVARGGLAEIYSAEDTVSGRTVAVKFPDTRRQRSPEDDQRFLREATLAARLEHPGIVPVYSVGVHAGHRTGYAMRLVRGVTLQESVREFHQDSPVARSFRSMQFRRLLNSFVTVCQTMSYAHRQGVIHLDLKPANIMLGEFGETIVVDWGLARCVSDESLTQTRESDDEARWLLPDADFEQTLAGVFGQCDADSAVPPDTFLESTLPRNTRLVSGFPRNALKSVDGGNGILAGTPGYMSPEQARGQLCLTGPHSDIYSLGATLFVILTGRTPHSGKALSEVLATIQTGRVQSARALNPEIPRALESICRKAMNLAPPHRYQTCQEMAMDLERWLADEPVSTCVESASDRISRLIRRHRQMSLVIAGSLLTLLAVMTAGLLALTRERSQTLSARMVAEENLQTACDALEQLYVRVSTDKLLNEPGMETLRLELLRRASGFYQRLGTFETHNPRLQFASARAMMRMGEIQLELNSPESAISVLTQTLEMVNSFPAVPESDTDVRLLMATTQQNLGKAFVAAERPEPAEECFWQALQTLNGISKSAENRSAIALRAADCLSNIGTAQAGKNRPDEALLRYHQATTYLEQIPPDDAVATEAIHTMARVSSNCAVILRRAKRESEVLPLYEQALRQIDAALKAEPKHADLRETEATTQFNFANFLIQTGDPDRALAELAKASQTLEQLIRDFPLRISFRVRRAKVVLNSGLAEIRRRKMIEAEVRFREAVAQLEQVHKTLPTLTDCAVDLAQAWQNVGNVLAGEEYERDPAAATQAYEQALGVIAEQLSRETDIRMKQRLLDVEAPTRIYLAECQKRTRPSR